MYKNKYGNRERLANYIIETGAVVHNHYETILKWWNEDRKV